jgi:hypothetical protein
LPSWICWAFVIFRARHPTGPTRHAPRKRCWPTWSGKPSARVRAAVIAVFLSHPEYADAVPAALRRLHPPERLTLQSFYLAAVFLQPEHAHRLRPFLASRWRWLPALPEAAAERNLPPKGTPRDRLVAPGREHRRLAQAAVNLTGTYEQAAGYCAN